MIPPGSSLTYTPSPCRNCSPCTLRVSACELADPTGRLQKLTAVAGLSGPVLLALTDRIQSVLSAHATSLSPNKTPERFSLVSRISHGGNALWIFGRDATTAGRLGKPLTSWLGLWKLNMSNKGAVGVRLPIRRGEKDGGWETLT